MTELRRRMLDDMALRGLSGNTQRAYVSCVRDLARYYRISPDDLSDEQVRGYLVALVRSGKVAPATVNQRVAALRLLYGQTLGRSVPALESFRSRAGRRLPVVLSRPEVRELLGNKGSGRVLHIRSGCDILRSWHVRIVLAVEEAGTTS